MIFRTYTQFVYPKKKKEKRKYVARPRAAPALYRFSLLKIARFYGILVQFSKIFDIFVDNCLIMCYYIHVVEGSSTS